jgi:peptidoglycan/xylan/chitin deacetylase (PgdA/CDA1 family)
MVKTFKRAALRAGQVFSVPTRVAESRWRKCRLAILCYHGIAIDDEHKWDPRLNISPEILESRFRMLRDGRYNVLALGEAVNRLYAGTLPPKSVAITFDDGCYDFYNRAYPLLRKYELPATVYLTTFYCYHPKPVFGMFCYYLMWKGRQTFPGGRLMDLPYEPDLSTEAGRMKAAADIVGLAEKRCADLAEKDALAEDLARQLGVDYQAVMGKRILQLMRPEEVAQLASEGLDVQLHTHRHRTPRDRGLFMREITDNRRSIREITGSDELKRHFCYPNGDIAPEFPAWLKEQDVISATTCKSGLASPDDDPLLLPRIVDTCGLNEHEFESWVSGVSEAAAIRLRIFGKSAARQT